jgi:hypothetical protein
MALRSFALIIGLLALAALAGQMPGHAADLLEEETFVTAEIGGWPYRLEALLIRPPTEPGQRLPVALITPGLRATAWIGRKFAHRT